MKKNILLAILLIYNMMVWSQKVLSTYPTIPANNGSGGIAFEITSSQNIELLNFSATLYTGTNSIEIWVRPGGVQSPPSITTSNGWVQLATVSTTSSSTTVPTAIPTTLNYPIPSGVNYGVFIGTGSGSSVRYHTHSSSDPSTYTDGILTITVGNNHGYGGNRPNPGNHPRDFVGSITYKVAATARNDAGVLSVDSPAAFCEGTHNILATIKNFGINQVDSVTVNWSFNGTVQTPIIYQQLLDTLNGTGSQTAQILLGTKTFTSGVTDKIVAWTSLPNNQQDTVTKNDTAMADVRPALYGNFTIDPGGSGNNNYVNFKAAVSDLNDFGICGPVVYTVASGTYGGQFEIMEIGGASATNTVTFTPATNATVTLKYQPTSSTDNYVIKLNKASYVSFDNMTITNGPSSPNYATMLELEGGASHNTFTNCHFDGVSYSTSTYTRVIYCQSAGNDFNRFIDNVIEGGYYNMYFYGGSTTSYNTGNEFIGNTFKDSYYYGNRIYYAKDLVFMNNEIVSKTTNSNHYPLYLYYCYGSTMVKGNFISTPAYYGIYAYNINGTSTDPSIIANNKIRAGNGSTYGYGIYYYGGFTRIVNNTIICDKTGSYYGLYVGGGANSILNNILWDQNGASSSYYALYYSGTFAVSESDYNDIFYANKNFGYFNQQYQSMSGWQTGTGFDQNSLYTDPAFNNFDSMRTCNDTLEGAGTPLTYINRDFDGDDRHPVTPDIGADEWIGSDSGAYTAGPDAIVCAGKTVVIGTKATGSTFNWSTNETTSTIEVSQEGTYQVTMTTSCGTSHMDEVVVTDETPVADFSSTISFLTGKYVNNSQKGNKFRWIVGTTPPDTLWMMNLTYIFPDNGPYDVCLTVFNDCDTVEKCETWQSSVGIQESGSSTDIIPYPNPVSDMLNVQFNNVSDHRISMEMYDIHGQRIFVKNLSNPANSTIEIDVSPFGNGFYLLKFITDDRIITKQLIIK